MNAMGTRQYSARAAHKHASLNTWYPLNSRLGGPQSRSGRGGEEKNSQPPPGNET
jgi:hypothetical protein